MEAYSEAPPQLTVAEVASGMPLFLIARAAGGRNAMSFVRFSGSWVVLDRARVHKLHEVWVNCIESYRANNFDSFALRLVTLEFPNPT